MHDFQKRLTQLDLSLCSHVTSQSSDGDKTSLLALQSACRQTLPGFVYLEIGSFMGGSLQTHVVDPLCRQIISIDPRSTWFEDERGERQFYGGNTAKAMMEGLQKIPGANLAKIVNLETGTTQLASTSIPTRPDLCFIDGEHTDGAVIQDSRFCLSVVKEDGIIAYHDANIVYRGIDAVIKELEVTGRPFRAFHLPDSIFVIELDNCRISETEPVRSLQRNNYKGYLWSLKENEYYRTFYNRPLVRLYRRCKAKTWDRAVRKLKRLT